MWSGTDDILAVDLFLYTFLIDKYGRRIFSANRRLVRWHSQPFNIVVPFKKTQNAATVANHIDGRASSASVADDMYRRVMAAKAAALASYTYTPVLVPSSDSCIVVSELTNECAGYATVQVKRGQITITVNTPFPILLTNTSDKRVHLPKRTIVVQVADSPAHITATEAALQKPNPKTIGAVHYKPSVARSTKMTRHKDVQAKDERKLKLNWKGSAQRSHKYAAHCD